MSKKIDIELIESSMKNILIALGDDPEREGLKETPKRVANMFQEVFSGMKYTNKEIAKLFSKCFEDEDFACPKYNNMIIVKDISIFSYCEHHMALMYNMKATVAYIPREKVLGLSKIIRIADMVSRRLQLQERIGMDIADVIEMATDSKDVAVIIEGEHSCMSARGIKKHGSLTKTAVFKGEFDKKEALKRELLLLINEESR